MLLSIRNFFLHFLGGTEMMWDVAFGIVLSLLVFACVALIVLFIKSAFDS